MNPSLQLRLTPSNTSSNSPYTPSRPSPLRSPTKSYRNELGISLRQVVGSTASSRNALDSAGTRFAYSAGAAAVVATYDPATRRVDQRFFRAKPTALPLNPSPVVYDHTPSQTPDARARGTPLRHAGTSNSPFATPTRDWGDASSGGGKAWSARERVKAAACVSLSPSGRLLAVGEVGYNPRVIIFSTAADGSCDIPLTCLADHAFGVRCVAFSPDGRYLASLGAANDGFLYVWRINERSGAASLHASNKCTSHVTQIVWMGSRLVTVGTRHVKVWRVEESGTSTPAKLDESTSSVGSLDNRTLTGRNCVLGDLLEATYTSAVALESDRAVVCSDKGAVCLLYDTGGQVHFKLLASIDVSIRAALLLPDQRLLLAGCDGLLRLMRSESFTKSLVGQREGFHEGMSTTFELVAGENGTDLAALVEVDGLIGTLSTKGAIALASIREDGRELAEVFKLPAHGGAVLGVRSFNDPELPDSVYFTWAGDGSVMLWNSEGSCTKRLRVAVEQRHVLTDGTPNEVRVVRHLPSRRLLVTGDRLGVLRICDLESGDEVYSVRAHSAEITDIAVHDAEYRYVATAGRDRVIQVFRQTDDRWELLHTLDEHVGAVTGVAFSAAGEQLLSCSSDRTVVVRDRASRVIDSASEHAFIIARTITLKSTPLAMAFSATQHNTLYLSTIDRFVHRYDFASGKLLSSFKTGDGDGGDTVVMSALVAVPTAGGATILAGLSSTDKSIRLYDDSGTLLGRDWGHTEGVTDIAVLDGARHQAESPNQASLVTVALDGTIFTWQADLRPPKRYDALTRTLDLLDQSQIGSPGADGTSLLSRPPLRRVLSQSEVASFRAQSSPEAEDTPTRPSAQQSPPRVRRRVSRTSMLSTPRLEATPTTTSMNGSGRGERGRRRSIVHRSPSPPSPKLSAATLKRRKSMYPAATPTTNGHTLSKARSASNLRDGSLPNAHATDGTGALTRDTDTTCRALRLYRKKLAASVTDMPAETLRELQKELSLTLRAVGEKAKAMRPRAGQVDEEVLGRVLDQYSSKLVEMLDTRLASLSLGQSVSVNSSMAVGGAEMGVGSSESPATGCSSVLDSPIKEHIDEDEEEGREKSYLGSKGVVRAGTT